MRLPLGVRLAVIGWLARDLEVVEEDAPSASADTEPTPALVHPEERPDVVIQRKRIELEHPDDFHYDMTDPKIRYMVITNHQPVELFFLGGGRLTPFCRDCGQAWKCLAQQALDNFYQLHPAHAEEMS